MDTKLLCYAILANNRYAKKPSNVPTRQWTAVRATMEQKFTKEYMDTPDGLYTNAQIWTQMFKQYIEQIFINYAINEANSDDVAQVLNVDAEDIQSALIDFAEEWTDADVVEDADEVIDKWVEFFTTDYPITDVQLTKHHNGGDMLEWQWNGKYFWEQGEFVVENGKLFHTFIAPNGKEILISTEY